MSDILTYDQYADIERRGFEMPYVVTIRQSKQELLFYGSEHTNDPAHSQFGDIEERWNTFVAEAAKPIALVEGRFDETPREETKDRERSIKAGGEAQFVVYLARRDGVEITSPEPDRVWEANQLASEFTREKVVFYYLIRQISWWKRAMRKTGIESEAAKMLQLMQKTYEWDDVDFSVERMNQINEELFGRPLAWDAAGPSYDATTPTSLDHITNEISRRCGELRDEHIYGQIKQYWQAGRSPFAVFGSAHAIRLEPALRKLAKA